MGGKFDELNAELIDRMEASSMEYYGRKPSFYRRAPALCHLSSVLSLLKLLYLYCENSKAEEFSDFSPD